MPKSSLEEIEWKGTEKEKMFTETMKSIDTRKMTRINLLFNETIWSDKFTTIITDLPTQRITQIPINKKYKIPTVDSSNNTINNSTLTHLNSTTTPSSGKEKEEKNYFAVEKFYLLAIDSSDKFFSYWDNIRNDVELLQHVKNHLSRIFSIDKSSIPDPLLIKRKMSGNQFPDYSRKYFWKKDIDWCHIKKAMFRPVSHENVFVVNDSFDTVQNQGSLETLLRNADDVLKQYFSDYITTG